MALEQSRFFDSVNGDKKYTAEQFAEYFRQFLTDGIKNGGTNMQVTADGSGLVVSVGYGMALIQGYMYWLTDNATGKKTLAISASSTLPRIDRVVLRLDKQLASRSIMLSVKTGTPAASPVAPPVTRDGNVYELSLAQVTVRSNTSTILATDIKDDRFDQSVCGLINSLITLDSSTYHLQFQQMIAQLASQGYVPLAEATDTAVANKLLRLDSDGKLPASITGDAQNAENASFLDGKNVTEILQQLAPNITEIRLTRADPTPTTEPVLWIKY